MAQTEQRGRAVDNAWSLDIQNPGFGRKLVLIGILILILQAALLLVHSMIEEREARHHQAVAEMARSWSLPQEVGAPILAVPLVQGDGYNSVRGKTVYLLPAELSIAAQIHPEVRYRGIFKAVLYRVDLAIRGKFSGEDLQALANAHWQIDWKQAYVDIGLGDTRGLSSGIAIDWHGREVALGPVTDDRPTGIFNVGLRATDLDIAAEGEQGDLPFALALSLNGSGPLTFAPFGRETTITVAGAWPAPSFMGAVLPAERTITKDGFSAKWELSHFSRNYPQTWTLADLSSLAPVINDSMFGVELIEAVTGYRQIERAVKYGILFLALSFLAYFLFETISDGSIHLVQYGFLGLSVFLFYLLLLSISEKLGFGWAYFVSTLGTVGQATAFTYSVTGKSGRAAWFGGLLLGLYLFFYIVLRLETYSLLSGSVALFGVLSATMYLTRNVDWFAFGRANAPSEAASTED